MPRRREPIDLLVAKGKKNLTKEEIERRRKEEIKVGHSNIEPPSYLPEDLKKEFNKISNILIEIGIMTDLDETALARFLIAEYQYQQITLKMLRMKRITDRYLDYARLQDRYFKQARLAAGDLGLTISSRCKLILPKDKQLENNNQTEGQKRFGNRL